MKKKKFGILGMAIAMSLAGGIGVAQVGQSLANAPVTQNQRSASDMKATAPTKSTFRRSIYAQSGGLDVIREGGEYGMSPMQYGMRYGNGKSRKIKHNRLRYSHNAKVNRRNA